MLVAGLVGHLPAGLARPAGFEPATIGLEVSKPCPVESEKLAHSPLTCTWVEPSDSPERSDGSESSTGCYRCRYLQSLPVRKNLARH